MTDLRVNLVLPVLRLGAGPFSFDPIAHLVGAPIAELLEPVLAGDPVIRSPQNGPPVEVFPLRLPEGEGASLALGKLGEIGFQNVAGQLVLTVPRAAARWVTSRFGAAVVDGPREVVLEGSRVACLTVALRSGMRASWPMGVLGEVGLEAV
jgi:hypothetical protein